MPQIAANSREPSPLIEVNTLSQSTNSLKYAQPYPDLQSFVVIIAAVRCIGPQLPQRRIWSAWLTCSRQNLNPDSAGLVFGSSFWYVTFAPIVKFDGDNDSIGRTA